MLKPKDIKKQNSLSKDQRHSFEKEMQQDDLHYLSSVSFETFNVSEKEIDAISNRISQKTSGRGATFQSVFVSGLCGLLIGVSIFFGVFYKTQNHPSVWQDLSSEEPISEKTLNNTVNHTDTLFPEITKKLNAVEHFHTTENQIPETKVIEPPDMLSTLSSTLSVEEEENNDIVLQFIPNAPVIFIHQLKVTNYKAYYFKQAQSVNLAELSGLSAQYESEADRENFQIRRSNAYLAHKIIQNAMRLFNAKHYANCIEELTLLYNYNNDDANAQFYLGMSYFLTNKFGIAQSYFQKNLDNQNNIFHQESDFYQALCFLSTNQKEKALSQLQQIVTNKGFYSKRAQEVLDKEKK